MGCILFRSTKISPLVVNRGKTKITFLRKLGVPNYDAKISRLDAPDPILLTPNYGDDINLDLCVTHNGSDWAAHDQLQSSTSNVNFFGREFYFEFSALVVVDYVYFTSQYLNQALGEFSLKALNDKKNWTTESTIFEQRLDLVGVRAEVQNKGKITTESIMSDAITGIIDGGEVLARHAIIKKHLQLGSSMPSLTSVKTDFRAKLLIDSNSTAPKLQKIQNSGVKCAYL